MPLVPRFELPGPTPAAHPPNMPTRVTSLCGRMKFPRELETGIQRPATALHRFTTHTALPLIPRYHTSAHFHPLHTTLLRPRQRSVRSSASAAKCETERERAGTPSKNYGREEYTGIQEGLEYLYILHPEGVWVQDIDSA